MPEGLIRDPLSDRLHHRGSWVGVVANAGSGRGNSRKRVDSLVRILRDEGVRAKVVWTPNERVAMVAEADPSSGCLCLIAAGGDGTVAAVVNEQPKVPITVLPAGTENLFARYFGIGRNPIALANMVLDGQVVRLDLGVCGTRRFTLMAGLGFDADVVTRHHDGRIRNAAHPRPTHRGMYVEPVMRSSLGYPFPEMRVTVGDETLIGSSVFLFNLPSYALGLPFAPSARGDDGLLDLVVFRKRGPIHALRYLAMVVLKLHVNHPGVEHRKVRKVTVDSEDRVPIQLDGDPGGRLEIGPGAVAWSAEVLPSAVDVLVPRSFTVK